MQRTRYAAVLAAAALLVGTAHAELVRCTDQRVEYLIGGGGDKGSKGDPAARTTCAPAPSRNAEAQGAAPHRTIIVKPDDDGRREILNQELRKEREALAQMDRAPPAAPGAASAGIEEQRARHQADLEAIEAELRRLR